MSEKARWYVVHTYSGHENKVKANIEKIVENRGMEDIIVEVAVPTEEIVETKNGKRKVKQRKIFPGYCLVKMFMTDESWYVVRNTRGVTGFVGPGSKPIPLTDEEVYKMGIESKKVSIDMEIGQQVRVMTGPFESFIGVVEDINADKQTLKVLINMFGRETPVELEFNQVDKNLDDYNAKDTSFGFIIRTLNEGGATMAKKVTGMIKLQIPAGKATPAPPVGPALGQHGVNIMQFCKEFNAKTNDQAGLIIPVVISVYQDRSFSFITKTPPAAVLLKKSSRS